MTEEERETVLPIPPPPAMRISLVMPPSTCMNLACRHLDTSFDPHSTPVEKVEQNIADADRSGRQVSELDRYLFWAAFSDPFSSPPTKRLTRHTYAHPVRLT